VAPRFLENLCVSGVAISHNRPKSGICFVTRFGIKPRRRWGIAPCWPFVTVYSIYLYSQRPCMSGSPYLCPQLQGVQCQNFTGIVVTLYTESFSVK